eukprot:tig00020563_g11391.t1
MAQVPAQARSGRVQRAEFLGSAVAPSFVSSRKFVTAASATAPAVPAVFAAITEVSEADFDETVLGGSMGGKAHLVYMSAKWCGPCKIVTAIVDEIAGEIPADKLKIVKLDLDECPSVASRYNVRSIPWIGIFKDAEVKETVVGGTTKETLMTHLKTHM